MSDAKKGSGWLVDGERARQLVEEMETVQRVARGIVQKHAVGAILTANLAPLNRTLAALRTAMIRLSEARADIASIRALGIKRW